MMVILSNDDDGDDDDDDDDDHHHHHPTLAVMLRRAEVPRAAAAPVRIMVRGPMPSPSSVPAQCRTLSRSAASRKREARQLRSEKSSDALLPLLIQNFEKGRDVSLVIPRHQRCRYHRIIVAWDHEARQLRSEKSSDARAPLLIQKFEKGGASSSVFVAPCHRPYRVSAIITWDREARKLRSEKSSEARAPLDCRRKGGGGTASVSLVLLSSHHHTLDSPHPHHTTT
jgi:hypothetical protein